MDDLNLLLQKKLKNNKIVSFFMNSIRSGIQEEAVIEFVDNIIKYRQLVKDNDILPLCADDEFKKSHYSNSSYYQSFEYAKTSMDKAIKDQNVKNLMKSVFSNKYKFLINDDTNLLFHKLVEHNINKKELSIGIGKNIATFISSKFLNQFIEKEFIKPWKYDEYIKNASKDSVVDYESNVLTLKITDFNDMKYFGSPLWCISFSDISFSLFNNNYLYDYYLEFDFNKTNKDPLSLCVSIVDTKGKIIQKHDKRNNLIHFDKDKQYSVKSVNEINTILSNNNFLDNSITSLNDILTIDNRANEIPNNDNFIDKKRVLDHMLQFPVFNNLTDKLYSLFPLKKERNEFYSSFISNIDDFLEKSDYLPPFNSFIISLVNDKKNEFIDAINNYQFNSKQDKKEFCFKIFSLYLVGNHYDVNHVKSEEKLNNFLNKTELNALYNNNDFNEDIIFKSNLHFNNLIKTRPLFIYNTDSVLTFSYNYLKNNKNLDEKEFLIKNLSLYSTMLDLKNDKKSLELLTNFYSNETFRSSFCIFRYFLKENNFINNKLLINNLSLIKDAKFENPFSALLNILNTGCVSLTYDKNNSNYQNAFNSIEPILINIKKQCDQRPETLNTMTDFDIDCFKVLTNLYHESNKNISDYFPQSLLNKINKKQDVKNKNSFKL